MKKFILPFLFAVIGVNAQTPSFQWAKSLITTNKLAVNSGKSIVSDPAGNTYITGDFEGTVDFDPGPGVYNLSITPPQDNIYILKLDPAGNFVWVKEIVAVNGGTGRAIVLDPAGNIYSTGFFKGTIDFDPGAGVSTLVADSNHSAYVLKLDPAGNFMWASNVGGNAAFNSADGESIALDGTGNIYTTGYFYGTVDFDPSAGIHNITGTGGENSFVTKLDNSGNFQWASTFGGTSAVTARSISVDSWGDVLTTGYFSQTADFDPGAAIFNLSSAPSSISIYISKLDASGNFAWAKVIGGTSGGDDAETYSLLTDAANNVYTSGDFNGTVDFDPGTGTANRTAFSESMFVSKLDASGNFVWVKTINAAPGGSSTANSLVADAGGNFYATGQFSGTCDFDPAGGVANLSMSGTGDAFVLALDNNGNYLWAVRNGGSGFANTRGQSLTVDASSNVYSVGKFQGTVDFDFGTGVYNVASMGTSAIYIQKISQSEIATGFGSSTVENSFSVYPNPTNGLLKINSGGPKASQIRIRNVLGEIIYSLESNTEETTLDISSLQNGIYFIQISSNAGTELKTIVKQ